MNNKELRAEIEQHIRRNGVGNETFEEMHIKYYNEFFRIFSELSFKYEDDKTLNKKIKIIDFIEKMGKLEEYLEIVKGNSIEVENRVIDSLREERKIIEREMLEELKKNHKPKRPTLEEWLEKNGEVVNLNRN
jgi:hypothetical protein